MSSALTELYTQEGMRELAKLAQARMEKEAVCKTKGSPSDSPSSPMPSSLQRLADNETAMPPMNDKDEKRGKFVSVGASLHKMKMASVAGEAMKRGRLKKVWDRYADLMSGSKATRKDLREVAEAGVDTSEEAGKALAKETAKVWGARAGTGAAATGVGAGVTLPLVLGGKKKEGSAFEKLAQDRAELLLKTAADNLEGADEYDEDVTFDDALNARALEMIDDSGYDAEKVATILVKAAQSPYEPKYTPGMGAKMRGAVARSLSANSQGPRAWREGLPGYQAKQQGGFMQKAKTRMAHKKMMRAGNAMQDTASEIRMGPRFQGN